MHWDRQQGLLFASAAFLFVGLTFFLLRRHILLDLQPWGDVAADMLRTRQIAEDGYLLTGHYSRFGFNHPGPFFFYVNFLCEKLFMPFGVKLHGAWYLSMALLNLAFAFLAAWLMSQLYQSRPLVQSVAIVALLVSISGIEFFNPWMPYRLYLPFMAYLLTVALIMQGRMTYLPLATALCGILVHGYITMPLFTLLPLGLAVMLGFPAWRRHAVDLRKRVIVSTVLVAAAAALPVLLDVVMHTHSNAQRIMGAFIANRSSAYNIGAAADLLRLFWSRLIFPLLLVLIIWLPVTLVTRKRAALLPLLPIFVLVAFVSLLFVLYHASAPPPLHEFIGYFYRGVVLVVIAMLGVSTLVAFENQRLQTLLATMVLALAAWLYAAKELPVPRDAASARALASALSGEQRRQLRLDYSPNELFADMAGIVYNLRVAGIDACIARPGMAYLFTDNATCDSSDADYLLIPATDCAGHCLFDADMLGIQKLPQ